MVARISRYTYHTVLSEQLFGRVVISFQVDGDDRSALEEDDGEDSDTISEAISRLEDYSFPTILGGDERRSNISD